MKHRSFNETYSECSINEQEVCSSNESTETTIAKSRNTLRQSKWKSRDLHKIHKDVHKKCKGKKINEELSVLDDFKIIIFGCMGMRTYKIFCYS
ncbi:hypothetical protein, conserved [Plasmodium gonderi]|uniref:Uncharacterized protein n=1 Tax=Plasmodium gonderi TaxID=77519 RepID=A0A1Y1JFN4_PLAGO|nr:hypothetical protein, conserved [Plasmodium gonderi]GAW81341.1 hypothetical protein, conserved [Plasmodium gonderi]